MIRRLFMLGLLALPCSLPLQAATSPLDLSGGWIRLLPGQLPAGGYFTLHNSSDHPVRLVGATSPDYGNVMLHHSAESGGQSRMVMVDSVPVPAHGTLKFAPGGYHLMLTQPKTTLKAGGKVPVTLRFNDGETLTAPFALRPADANSP